jgi:two-component system CitB family response regulator
MIRTLIVEDDFRVARLHEEVVTQLEAFEVVALAHTATAAIEAARNHAPDLVLLDIYLPDATGLEVLRRLRALPKPADVIVLSAAREMESVREAMQRGALHYLIKPFDLDDLRTRLRAYARLHDARAGRRETHQDEVDRLFGLVRAPPTPAQDRPPKGHSTATAELVLGALRDDGGPLSATDVAARTGVSRSTAQRYLAWLTDSGVARRRLRYGNAGRPEHLYELPSA